MLTTGLGYIFSIPLPPLIGLDPKWGAAGLTASAGIAGWIEFALLRGSLNRRIGRTGLSLTYVSKLWFAAAVGAAVGWAIKLLIGVRHPVIVAALVLLPYGITYFAISSLLGLNEAKAVIRRVFTFVRLER